LIKEWTNDGRKGCTVMGCRFPNTRLLAKLTKSSQHCGRAWARSLANAVTTLIDRRKNREQSKVLL
jgi:hypothetical protein